MHSIPLFFFVTLHAYFSTLSQPTQMDTVGGRSPVDDLNVQGKGRL